MKKLFVSILTLAAFVACQSDFGDVNLDAPQGGNANVGGSHTVYAEVGIVENETKATYTGLKATWEEGDKIALLQEHADYGKTFSVVNQLNIKDGWGTSSALFNGEISVDATAPRVYHIAYPASAVEFNTTMSQSVTVESYNFQESSSLMGYYTATGYATCTYNSTLNIIVPTTQSGKWEPYMYASTSESVNSNAIGAKVLTTLNGAIAIRAFESDGKTPKQLQSITITSSSAPIAGAFTGTATSVGRTTSIAGERSSGPWSNVIDSYIERMKSEARQNLTDALQGYEATSTSVTTPLSLSFAGSDKSITATNLDVIDADAEGYYTYHLNAAPFENSDLTIELMDTKGLKMKCTVSARSLSAGHRSGYTINWVDEKASLTGEYIKTWYENYNDNFTFADNTLYVGKLEVIGNISAENVVEMGVMVGDTAYGVKKNVLSIAAFSIPLDSGDYNVYAYAKVMLNGEEKILKAYEDTYKVTPIPTLDNYSVVSSYSKDGKVEKNNQIDGRSLTVTASLSTDYFANKGLISSFAVYNNNDNNKLADLTNGEWSTTSAELGQYSCYVKILLENGYLITSKTHTTHVTGIPCEANWTVADYKDWPIITANDKGKYIQIEGGEKGGVFSPKFYLPTATSINAYVAASGVGNKNRAMYVAVVNGDATSLVTSGSSMDTTYEAGGAATKTGYTTWTASSLSISDNQKLSVAVYGGTFLGAALYKGYLYKVRIEYK